MKREMLPLVHLARRGNPDAMPLVGRGCLCGEEPLSLHPETGIRYLTRAAAAGCAEALATLAEVLSLEQIVRYGLLPQLREAAARGVHVAEFKLGLRLIAERDEKGVGLYRLWRAASAMPKARIALANVLVEENSPVAVVQGLRLLRAEALAGNARAPLARAALDAADLQRFAHALQRACGLATEAATELHGLRIDALLLEQARSLSRAVAGASAEAFGWRTGQHAPSTS